MCKRFNLFCFRLNQVCINCKRSNRACQCQQLVVPKLVNVYDMWCVFVCARLSSVWTLRLHTLTHSYAIIIDDLFVCFVLSSRSWWWRSKCIEPDWAYASCVNIVKTSPAVDAQRIGRDLDLGVRVCFHAQERHLHALFGNMYILMFWCLLYNIYTNIENK